MLLKPALIICSILIVSATQAQQNWPRTIEAQGGGQITLYQPQPESLDGNIVKGRTAFSARKKPSDDPVFGALWFTATMETNRDTRTAVLQSLKIDNIKVSGVDDTAKTNILKTFLETEVPKLNLQTTLDEILSSIEEEQKGSSDNLKNDPPEIIYTDKPSTLVLIDGEPRLKDDEKLKMKRVINTAFLILQHPKQKKYYLYGGAHWYVSPSITTGWAPAKKLPKDIRKIDKQIKELEKKNNQGNSSAKKEKPPELIVATKPSELIQSEGQANFKSISGTQLLYMFNSDNNVFMELNSNTYFVLLSGRWYKAASLKGPWTYVPSDQLPEDFKKIPEGSPVDGVLASVAGTNAAKEATLDAQIPQTAKVDRKTATVTVNYDGEPKFEKIEGTNLELAMNTSSKVFKADNGYYCVDNGVWYRSASPKGPWQVSDERPKGVEDIPPSSSAYNTKYVYVYDSTPEYVYVGYTPGYMGAYVYGPTVVYGTGYYYYPWYGPYYYPHPYTFGFSMHYNPWCGWSMGFGFSMGFFSMGIYGGYGGYWGPPMYRPPYYPGGGYNGHHVSHYNRNTVINNRDNNINRGNSNNIYRDRNGVSTNDQLRRSQGNRASQQPANRNNVVADRQGNVYQRGGDNNWSQRNANGWQPANNANTRDLDRQMQNRDRGQSRNAGYNNMNRGGNMGGGYRGGGGGGRRR
ncbi:hypothetical protein [Flavisolibacter tropicus]|uniref:hypothetical protein n=1 Tax=Flavisolibacter tropicus TaxID=1492898 RepID=UPI00083542C7|nr:hypothetical protein [Flavisolibacter tropicus]